MGRRRKRRRGRRKGRKEKEKKRRERKIKRGRSWISCQLSMKNFPFLLLVFGKRRVLSYYVGVNNTHLLKVVCKGDTEDIIFLHRTAE